MNAAIIIDADDVTINLCSWTLKQNLINSIPNFIGIKVITNHKNITITNGTIENFTALGIWFESGVHDVYVYNLNLLNCGSNRTAPYATTDGFNTSGIGFYAGGI